MNITQTEKTKLYDALALFQNAFRTYLVKSLKDQYGDNWLNNFKESLLSQQVNNLERSLQNNPEPERSIDFQHFKSFALRNKDLIRNDFGNKTNDLPTWLVEIVEVRNKIAHFEEISQDEATKAWIHLRTIARIIGENEIEREILNLETSKHQKQDLSEIRASKPERHLAKHKTYSDDLSSIETLDIVNCAKSEFREMVLSHNVYMCPAKGGAYNHKQCKYLGVYWEKRVGAIGEIEAVVDVHSQAKAEIYYKNGDNTSEEYISRAKEKALKLRPEELPLRVFLVENLHPTDFIKDSPGGMFGSKIYLNIEDLGVTDAKDLAEKLKGKSYSDFGLQANDTRSIIEFVEAAVSDNPILTVKVVQGGHHRIMRSGWHGSLWMVKTATRGYRVETNGDVKTYLNSKIKHLLGREPDQITAKGFEVWFIENADDVKKIIDIYGQI